MTLVLAVILAQELDSRDRRGWKDAVSGARGRHADADPAVVSALDWLARHQKDDGSWAAGRADYDAGVTGLAVLAFLGAGRSHRSPEVRKTLQWILDHQDIEGRIGGRVPKFMYNHLICALALVDAYGLTGSYLIKSDAQRAVDFAVAAQNPGSGWRYDVRGGESDSSVTGWGLQVLRVAEWAGLNVPPRAMEGVRAWFDQVSDRSYGRFGYRDRMCRCGIPPPRLFDSHESTTAFGLLAMEDGNSAALLIRDLPSWKEMTIDFYYWHAATIALHDFHGKLPAEWDQALKDAILPHQRKDGSWDPVDAWSEDGGRAYATALNALTLETYYRYPGRSRK